MPKLTVEGFQSVDVEEGKRLVLAIEQDAGRLRDGVVSARLPADAPVPEGAEILDGRGRFLIPGLWDMHAHVYAVSPLLDLPLYIAYGVTNVRDMQGCPKPGDPFIACAEDKRRWTNEAIAGTRVGPRIIASTSSRSL